MHRFCDVQVVWRAALFLGQKGRLWVPFRLLVVGVRIRIVVPIRWKKLFYKHLSLPFCPNFSFYHQMRSMCTKCQSNAFGSHTRSVSSESSLRYILAMTLTPVTARVQAQISGPGFRAQSMDLSSFSFSHEQKCALTSKPLSNPAQAWLGSTRFDKV